MLWCSSALCDLVDAFFIVESAVFSMTMWCTQSISHLFESANDNNDARALWLWGVFLNGSVSLSLFCILVLSFLKITHVFLKYKWQSYARLPSENRQLYVLANLCKASCLAILFFSKIWINDVYDAFALDQWDTIGARRLMRIKNISALYVATDVVALYVVPKLPTTTVIHHYVAWFLAMIIFGTDVRLLSSNVVRMILLYGAWSTIPYSVNAFLALRRLFEDNVEDSGDVKQDAKPVSKRVWLEVLAIFSLVIYAVTCACNWIWHMRWFIDQLSSGVTNWYNPPYNASFYSFFLQPSFIEWFPTVAVMLYSMASVMLARDDVILMQWLWERALTNYWFNFVAQTVLMTKTVAWVTCKSLFSRPLKHIVAEEKAE